MVRLFRIRSDDLNDDGASKFVIRQGGRRRLEYGLWSVTWLLVTGVSEVKHCVTDLDFPKVRGDKLWYAQAYSSMKTVNRAQRRLPGIYPRQALKAVVLAWWEHHLLTAVRAINERI